MRGKVDSGALDLALVADTVVFVTDDSCDAFNDEAPFGTAGYQLISTLRMQGMPTVMGVACAKTSESMKESATSSSSSPSKQPSEGTEGPSRSRPILPK